MENQLQKSNQSISLSDKQVFIAMLVQEVNMLVPYPLSDGQIEQWARNIDRILPELNPDCLAQILDEFKTEEREWDTKKGIQNLFTALIPRGYSPEEII